MSVLVLAPSLGNAEKKKPFKFERAGPYAINVDYSKKLAEMIEAGNYRANGAVSDENFTVYGSGKVELEVEIIHFDKKIETSEVLEELAKHELTPAYIEHLLAFGAQHPDKQEKYGMIVALGAPGAIVIGGEEREYEDDGGGGIKERKKATILIEPIVAYLVGGGNRELDCLGFEGPGLNGWSTDYYFLAMKKNKK